jgi:hypothetical protein
MQIYRLLSLRFLWKTRVLPIFWTVTVLPPISILRDKAIPVLAEVNTRLNAPGNKLPLLNPLRVTV